MLIKAGSIVLLLLWLVVCAEGDITEEYVEKHIAELTPGNVSSNLAEWEQDLAIMFYAPWCKYCKQLLPTWGTIAALKKNDGDIVVGKFDCEASQASTDTCRKLGVDRYPSVFFLGYGNFNQAEGGALIGDVHNPRLVKYVADLYPEAVFDWVQLMCTMSVWHRRWDDFKGFFTGKSRASRQLSRMKARVAVAERKAELFGKELEKYKAVELFESLEDHGDPFPLLHSLEPDEQNLPLRMCVGEAATEYCKYFPEDRYCVILDNCVAKQLGPKVCRPEECPFDDALGCRVVSMCMQPSVIKQYQDALAGSLGVDVDELDEL